MRFLLVILMMACHRGHYLLYGWWHALDVISGYIDGAMPYMFLMIVLKIITWVTLGLVISMMAGQ